MAGLHSHDLSAEALLQQAPMEMDMIGCFASRG